MPQQMPPVIVLDVAKPARYRKVLRELGVVPISIRAGIAPWRLKEKICAVTSSSRLGFINLRVLKNPEDFQFDWVITDGDPETVVRETLRQIYDARARALNCEWLESRGFKRTEGENVRPIWSKDGMEFSFDGISNWRLQFQGGRYETVVGDTFDAVFSRALCLLVPESLVDFLLPPSGPERTWLAANGFVYQWHAGRATFVLDKFEPGGPSFIVELSYSPGPYQKGWIAKVVTPEFQYPDPIWYGFHCAYHDHPEAAFLGMREWCSTEIPMQRQSARKALDYTQRLLKGLDTVESGVSALLQVYQPA